MAESVAKITVPGEISDEAKVREVTPNLNERASSEVAGTPVEREAVIETARNLDPAAFDTDAHVARPGKYECAQDLPLVVALDIINGHGFADESAGDAAMGGYAWRVGRFVALEDTQGFMDVEVHPTERHAADRLRNFDVPSEHEES